MLFMHQIGSVKIGEIVRYNVTYTPALDRILPAPEYLYLKVRNTSNSALRAAFVHGPYTLYVDAYPAHFDPNEKFAHPRKYGVPEFEPMLKAGGSWTCRLLVPEHVRDGAGSGTGTGTHAGEDGSPPSVSWIINVSSQVIFSTSAAVHFEVLLARDPKALESGGGITAGMPVLLGGGGDGHGSGKGGGSVHGQVLQPGRMTDYQRGRDGRHPDQPRGVFSRAIRMRLEDTTALWNKPELPGWSKLPSSMRIRTDDSGVTVEAVSGGALGRKHQNNQEEQQKEQQKTLEQNHESKSQATQQARDTIPAPKPGQKKKKIHLVILTHGLHSNLGGDMLYIKESIDVAVQQAKIDRKARKEKERAARAEARKKSGASDRGTGEEDDDDLDDEDEEDVIVRGYPGNATRTERGIKYLGKRLARYILSMTYPDQPFLPSTKKVSENAAVALHGGHPNDAMRERGSPAHKHSTIQNAPAESLRGYQFTKISFIAHSLGGLVQTYAVAYIQKHSPQFFDLIEPVNFIGMASPFLGLNHENPMYVKFALDFGLVGRTGQDLGLTWRAPTIARSGWSSLVGNLGDSAHKKVLGEPQPESKPLLRILPTGPAHTALKKFRNRTVYSNVVNDGIVPLRTSCLLFLDWQGLDRVEKARREAGLVETVVGFGWAELVGNNATTPRTEKWDPVDFADDDDEKDSEGTGKRTSVSDSGAKKTETATGDNGTSGTSTPNVEGHNQHEVPQPSKNATQDDDRHSLRAVAVSSSFDHDDRPNIPSPALLSPDPSKLTTASTNNSNPFSNFFSNLFKNSSSGSTDDPTHSPAGTTPRHGSVVSGGGSSSNLKALGQDQHSHPPTQSTKRSKQSKIYQRSQTLRSSDWDAVTATSTSSSKSRVTTGQELDEDASNGGSTSGGMSAPPRTSFFESATDIINPKLPSVEFLIDPSKRPRAIFHDRIYHPSDIPAPPLKRRSTGNLALRRLSLQQRSKIAPGGASGGGNADNSASNSKSRSSSPFQERSLASGGSGSVPHMDSGLSAQDYDDMVNTNPDREPDEVIDTSSIKVEEKIARAYHRGLSWRKVLVKLEPDAHNNMVVRRMFANAFGWPVVKHMVDAHFSDSAAARMRDDDEDNNERARPLYEAPDEHGAETQTQKPDQGHENAQADAANDDGDAREAQDQATDLPETHLGSQSRPPHHDNVAWTEGDWNDSGDESDSPDGSTGAADDDLNLAYGASSKEQKQVPKSPLSSSMTGVSVTATGGTTTGPQSPLNRPLSSPAADSILPELSISAPKEEGHRS
ncbi:uncharacterized protein SPSK_08352 [Sporothrix schenckii 1099-18]|uniref:DUF676 domain-containing protein n=1 Tax=Sporothrix schenckii 1099-18 TaxID=1397361 RepID=A0A0F2M7S2_SPOSC|nr:uncharacterized protein SPSK_08352 [Sporothrix schenckii 1099-18]KJR85687.1 hypothetical protein SPSK_08352 [Sporothrix schenckii 1099-18]